MSSWGDDLDRRKERRRLLKDVDAEIRDAVRERATFTTDIGAAIDATPLTIEPGSQHYLAAMRQGREDEYCDRMRARYGGEW